MVFNDVRIVGSDGKTRMSSAATEAPQFVDYAILCANVYMPGVKETLTGHNWEDWISQKKRIPLPVGWTRCLAIEKFVESQKTPLRLDDLVMEVWERPGRPGEEHLVALVYRGTANLRDWISNLNWFWGRWVSRIPPLAWLLVRTPLLSRFVDDKYLQLQRLLAVLIPRVEREYPGTQIVAAGHSLGGGLAQYSAYATAAIKQVYAFDPSFVTGFFSVKRERRQHNKANVKIYRIYNRGEILAVGRGPIKFLRNRLNHFRKPKRNAVTILEYGFRFERGVAFTLHAIGRLAWFLTQSAAAARVVVATAGQKSQEAGL
jgi:hypothetical protein